MRNKNTEKYMQENLFDLGYSLLSHYRNGNMLKVIIKDSDDYMYDALFHNIMGGNPPYFVAKSNPYSLRNISIWLVKNEKTFSLDDENTYKNAHEKLKFNCYVCKDYFYANWVNISNGVGCGVCDGVQLGKFHNLKYLFPEIASEFNCDRNNIDTSFILSGSNTRYWWLCNECGYEWKTSPDERTRNYSGCPVCAGQIVSDKNRLSLLRPIISGEWHPAKNGGVTPYDVAYRSSKRAWWLCKNNHFWEAQIASRSAGSGCPRCRKSGGEDKISELLSRWNIEHESEHSFPDCKNVLPLEFDFYIANYNICIEFQGEQHYYPIDFAGRGVEWAESEFKKNKKRDKIKENYCKDNNINLLIIPYWEFDNIEEILINILNEIKEGSN